MTEFELLEELARELSLPEIAPGEVTAQMVADRAGVSWSTAARTLKDKEAAGIYVSRKVRNQNGRPALAYRRAQ